MQADEFMCPLRAGEVTVRQKGDTDKQTSCSLCACVFILERANAHCCVINAVKSAKMQHYITTQLQPSHMKTQTAMRGVRMTVCGSV